MRDVKGLVSLLETCCAKRAVRGISLSSRSHVVLAVTCQAMPTAGTWLKIGLAGGLLIKLGGQAAVPNLMRMFGTAAGGFVATFQSAVDTFGVRGIVRCAVIIAVLGMIRDATAPRIKL